MAVRCGERSPNSCRRGHTCLFSRLFQSFSRLFNVRPGVFSDGSMPLVDSQARLIDAVATLLGRGETGPSFLMGLYLVHSVCVLCALYVLSVCSVCDVCSGKRMFVLGCSFNRSQTVPS